MFLRLDKRLMDENNGDGGDAGGAGDGDSGGSGGDSGAGGSGDGGGDGGDGGVTGYFEKLPDDWRSQLAGEDTKRLGQLERVSDMPTFVDNYFSAQDRIRKGELSNGLPENPTDQQMSDWRGANDVPATAEEYKPVLPDGLVLGEADTRISQEVHKAAHAHNLSNGAMSDLTVAMLKGREIEQQALGTADSDQQMQGTMQLKDAWGGEFTKNLNATMGWFNTMPEAIRDSFMSARMGDGRLLMNSPEFLLWSAQQGFAVNPSATVVPNANNPVQAASDEIEKLEKRMSEDDTWHKDTKAQTRLMELYDYRDSLKQKED